MDARAKTSDHWTSARGTPDRAASDLGASDYAISSLCSKVSVPSPFDSDRILHHSATLNCHRGREGKELEGGCLMD